LASSNTARIEAFMGASGMGKGLSVKAQLTREKPARLIVWDIMNEYAGHGRPVTNMQTLGQAMLRAGAAGPLRARYLPKGRDRKDLEREFSALCELVYYWQNCTFVAEELSQVTRPSWAPSAWSKMTTSGRHMGISIIGCSQTPAQIDKNFLGNTTRIRCFALREHAHRVAVARAMDIQDAEIAQLTKFLYIEKDFNTGQVSRGDVTPTQIASSPPPVPAATPSGSDALTPSMQDGPPYTMRP
jgi:hypothetical protein